MSDVPTAHHGAVLTGVKARPLRDGLRPALTPAPGGTNRLVIETPKRTEQDQIPLRGVSTVPGDCRFRRVVGAGRVWVLEGELDYGQGPWSAVVVIELDQDGLIERETRYYAEKSEPPDWRSAWVEALE